MVAGVVLHRHGVAYEASLGLSLPFPQSGRRVSIPHNESGTLEPSPSGRPHPTLSPSWEEACVEQSERRESNSQWVSPLVWKTSALPLGYARMTNSKKLARRERIELVFRSFGGFVTPCVPPYGVA